MIPVIQRLLLVIRKEVKFSGEVKFLELSEMFLDIDVKDTGY